MKKLLLLAFLSMLLFPSVLFAQELDKRFSVGVFGTIPMGKSLTLSHKSWNNFTKIEQYNKTFWKAGIEGGYTLPIYRRLIFQPTLSLNYSRHDGFFISLDGGCTDFKSHINEIQMDLCTPIGAYLNMLKTRIDVGTGPVLGWYLYQEHHRVHLYDHSSHEYEGPATSTDEVTRNLTRRLSFYWRFYAKCNFLNNRFYAKYSIDISGSDYVAGYKNRNQMSFGIGVNL